MLKLDEAPNYTLNDFRRLRHWDDRRADSSIKTSPETGNCTANSGGIGGEIFGLSPLI